MSATSVPDRLNAVSAEALSLFAQGSYAEAAVLWQQLADAGDRSAYWHLGLALLLQAQEADAQLVWMTPLLEADAEQTAAWIAELSQVLAAEADRQVGQNHLETAWLIRQHLRELNPNDLGNLLNLLLLDLRQSESIDRDLLIHVTDLLKEAEEISTDLLLEVLRQSTLR